MQVLTTAQLSSSGRFAIGLLSLLPLLVFVRGLLQIMRREDELHKRIQLEAIAWAAGTVIVLGFTLCFLEQFKVIGSINASWAAQVLIVVWGFAAAVLAALRMNNRLREAERQKAAQLARSVGGVKDVKNDIRLK